MTQKEKAAKAHAHWQILFGLTPVSTHLQPLGCPTLNNNFMPTLCQSSCMDSFHSVDSQSGTIKWMSEVENTELRWVYVSMMKKKFLGCHGR